MNLPPTFESTASREQSLQWLIETSTSLANLLKGFSQAKVLSTTQRLAKNSPFIFDTLGYLNGFFQHICHKVFHCFAIPLIRGNPF